LIPNYNKKKPLYVYFTVIKEKLDQGVLILNKVEVWNLIWTFWELIV